MLKAARVEKGAAIEKIEKIIKVNKKYLLALEEGRYDKLPGEIYAKNFTKAYASFLGLSQKKVLETLERELEITKKINQTETDKKYNTKYQTPRLIISPKIFRNIIILFLSLACLAYLGWQISAIFSPPPLKIIYPDKDLITSDNFITVEGQTLPEINVTINNQQILTDQNGHFSKSIDLQDGLNIIEIKAKKERSKESKEVRQIMVEQEKPVEIQTPAN